MKTKLLALGTLASLLTASSQAALISYSDFGGSPATTAIDNLADGTGFYAPWQVNANNASLQVASTTPLTYGSLTTTANYATSGGFNDFGRHITDAAGTLTNGTYWASLLIRPGSASAQNFGLGFAYNATPDTTGFPARGSTVLGIGRSGSDWIAGTGASNFASGNFTTTANQGTVGSFTNTTQLLVFKFELSSTASTNAAYIWLNPGTGTLGGADLSTVTANYSVSALAANSLRINGLFMRLGNDATNVFDELRLGTTYADVTPVASLIPEPSTFAALAGLGVLGFAATRRRRA